MKKLFVVSVLSAFIGGSAAQATTIQENTVFPDADVVISQLNDGSSIGVRDIPNPVHAVCGQSFKLTNAATIRAITFQSNSDYGSTYWNTGDDNIQLWIGADTDANVTNFVAGTTNLLTSFDVQGLVVAKGNFYTINLDSDLVLPAGDYAFQLHWTSTAGTHQWFFKRANGNGDYDDGGLIFVQKTDGSRVDYPTDASNLLLTSDMVFALHSAVVGTVPEFSVVPEEIDMLLGPSENLATGTVTAAYSADSTMDISMTISDESHPGSFSILSSNPQTLVSPTNNVLEFLYDNTVSNLTVGAATGLVTIAWSETGSGITNETLVPIGVALASAATFTRGGTDTTWDGIPGWNSNESGSWGAATRLPLGIDTIVLNNAGIADDALYVDIDAEVKSISIVNTATSAALAMTNDVTLSILNGLNVGNPGTAGTGMVHQAAGTITVGGNLSINSNTTAGVGSAYNMTGGELGVDGSTTVNGELIIDGGSYTLNNDNASLAGTGLIKLKSGTFSGSPNSSGGQNLRGHLEISGGTLSWLSQVICGSATEPATISVIGDAASITTRHIQTTDAYGSFDLTLNYVLNETGVSTIVNTSWMFLQKTKINVDGSAYTGGSQTINLIDGASLNGAVASSNITVAGFADGYTAEVTQDVGNGDVVLTIVAGGYTGWAADYGVGAGAENPDGDAVNNLYEYALGGDPTNSADTGMDSAIESGAGYLDYIHVRRVAGSNDVSYALALTDNLVIGSWTTNAGYTVVGYGPEVDGFDTVTNRINTAGKIAEFIDLVIEEVP